jgi:hypothetical protein
MVGEFIEVEKRIGSIQKVTLRRANRVAEPGAQAELACRSALAGGFVGPI